MSGTIGKEVIRIGFPVPLSGIYGVEAHEQLMAAKLAVEEFNSFNPGGRQAELLVEDTELKKELAIEKTEKLIQKDRVHFVVGALSAGDMLEISRVCHRHGVLYNAISQSDSILYRENRSPFTFHEGQNPHMTVGTVGRYVLSHFGERVAFLNADAEFGQHSLRGMLHVANQIGTQVLLNLNYPVGSKDFRSDLKKVLQAQPDTLVINNFGEDQFQAVAQARELGLFEKMRIVCPNFSVTQRVRGGDIYAGVVGAVAYDWQLEQHFDSAKSFNEGYRKLSGGKTPTSYSSYGYNGVRSVLDCVSLTNSLKSEDLCNQMLRLRFDYCKGPQFYRRLDHQSIQCVIIAESKSQSDMRSADDLFEIREIVNFLGPRAFLISRETR